MQGKKIEILLNKVEKAKLVPSHANGLIKSISIVKQTRCTNVSNLFYFGTTLYMFRTIFSRPSSGVQDSAHSIYVKNACCCIYSLELVMMDGKTVRNMYGIYPK